MIFEKEECELKGRKIELRSAQENEKEARMLVDYLKTVCGETRFLLVNSDEVKYTTESEMDFIRDMNESEAKLLILAFVDGEHAGNCSFSARGSSRRAKHRADIGIALFQKYTGFGLGRLMLERLLQRIKEAGFEQAELTVVSDNDRAYSLYRSLGFKEYGRLPKANKYDDGSYSDDIYMVLELES